MKEKATVHIMKEREVSYDIEIGQNLIPGIVQYVKSQGKKCAIITDRTVENLHGNKLIDALNERGVATQLFSFNDSEKTRGTKEIIEDAMLLAGFGRDSLIVALGGGTAGDLAGFIASTYCRGIHFIQVPTTLLAMVDSSVGGKTGVDTPHGKNMIGTFYQPKRVFIDYSFLKTLPLEEMKNGIAEIVKTALILDKELFFFIEKYAKNILEKERDTLLYVIRRSCELKGMVVEHDMAESTGERQILNFGHTIGHAIEAASGYKLKHGYCVSIGIAVESEIALNLSLIEEHDFHRIIALLKDFDLPTGIPGNLDRKKIVKNMSLDKKSVSGKPRIVLLSGIGRVKKEGSYSFEVPIKEIEKCLR